MDPRDYLVQHACIQRERALSFFRFIVSAWQLKFGLTGRVFPTELQTQMLTAHSLAILVDSYSKPSLIWFSALGSVLSTGSTPPSGSLNASSFASGTALLTPGLISCAFAFSRQLCRPLGLTPPSRSLGYPNLLMIRETIVLQPHHRWTRFQEPVIERTHLPQKVTSINNEKASKLIKKRERKIEQERGREEEREGTSVREEDL